MTPGERDAYLARIGWQGDAPAADRASIAALVRAHTRAIAFENLDPLMGRAVDLAPEAVFAKLVGRGRGGYCFEQNGLFRRVLVALGFAVTPLAARVLWNLPADAETPRTHQLLRVDLDEGPAIVDVGFGGATLTGVLALAPGIQETPHERFRLVAEPGGWLQQIEIAGEWRNTYRFDLTPQLAADYALANWWTSTHPESHFTRGLSLARALDDGRAVLRSGVFSIHRGGAVAERREGLGPEALVALIEQVFAIRVPDRAALLARLAAIG